LFLPDPGGASTPQRLNPQWVDTAGHGNRLIELNKIKDFGS
jgi:hypothetical protein